MLLTTDDVKNGVVPFRLNKSGRRKASLYIKELEAKRKEILDSGKDTAEDTQIPSIEDIECDINSFGLDDDFEYVNSWGVTDNYNADEPISLKLHEDFNIVDVEWEEAVNADEEETYYIFFNGNDGKYIKKYKPSLAKLVSSRTGWKYCLYNERNPK